MQTCGSGVCVSGDWSVAKHRAQQANPALLLAAAEGVPVSGAGADTKHSPYGYPPPSQYGPPPGYPGAPPAGYPGGGYGAPPPSYYGPPPGYGQHGGQPQQVYVQQGKPGADACLTACLAALCCCCM
jgi:hypothetical protein